MSTDHKTPHDTLRAAVIDLMAIGEIMQALAGMELSNSDAIEGTWIDYLGRQVSYNSVRANDALDQMKRRASA